MTDYGNPTYDPPHPADTRRPGQGDPPTTPPGALGAPAVPVAAMASQSTAIEATRAVAEVQALVAAARMFPRIEDEAVARMRELCALPDVIEHAFWSYRRAGQQLRGPTVQLMRALAGCWGNITHGTRELYRNDEVSEMQAWAWDLQLNRRVERNFHVPHRRDKDGGRVALTQDRDVYENNANQAARREREMIAQVLPAWFVAEAINLCEQGVQGDPRVPMAQRVAKVVAFFGDTYGVRPDQLEAYVEAPRNDWTVFDLARLQAVGSSIHRGETTAAKEFAPERVSREELVAQRAALDAARTPAPEGAPGLRPVDDGDDPEAPFDG